MNIQFIFERMVNTLQLHNCTFGERSPGIVHHKHHNQIFELFCCREGTVASHINQTVTEMRPGDWVLLKPGVRHQFINDFGYAYFQLHFDIDHKEMRELLNAAPCIHISGKLQLGQRLNDSLRQLEACIMPDSPAQKLPGTERVLLPLTVSQKLTVQAYVLLMIGEITGASANQTPNEKQDSSAYIVDTAHEIETRLEQLVLSECSITGIAEQLNLSRSRCTKIFRQVYGVSPRRYISQLKLNKAKELLSSTDTPVAVIASVLGFSSINHFSRQFRRWTGISPSRFRPKQSAD